MNLVRAVPARDYTLLAIPFFLLSGAFMTTGGVARRLIDFANSSGTTQLAAGAEVSS